MGQEILSIGLELNNKLKLNWDIDDHKVANHFYSDNMETHAS